MKHWKIGLAAVAMLAIGGIAVGQSVNRMEGGGSIWAIGSGGTLNVESGGVLNVKSGGALQIAGVDLTTAVGAGVTTPVAGVAASYKIARGETALDGSNPTDVATGLTTIVACSASIKTSSAPNLNTSTVTYVTSSATLSLYGWKPTSAASPNLTASTGTETIGWVCVGT